jgi:hypothetical protein
MQLIPATARRFGVTDPNDPTQNIRGGTEYLAWLIDRFGGNLEHALAGYNAGEGRVDQYGGIPPFKETREYVPKVLATYNLLRSQYGGPQAAQQAPGGPAVSPGLAPADMRPAAPTPQGRSIGAMGTDFGQAWAARQAAVPVKLTDREKIRLQSFYKERLEIIKSGASPDVQQRMLENLATDYPDVVGGGSGGAPGQAPGLSPEGTALFGLEGQGAAPAAGGTAGSGAPGVMPPGGVGTPSQRAQIQLEQRQATKTETQQEKARNWEQTKQNRNTYIKLHKDRERIKWDAALQKEALAALDQLQGLTPQQQKDVDELAKFWLDPTVQRDRRTGWQTAIGNALANIYGNW